MQLSGEKILLPIEPYYIKKIGREAISNVLRDTLKISVEEADSYLDGNPLRTAVDQNRFLIITEELGIPIYFTGSLTLTEPCTPIMRDFDVFKVLDENESLELTVGGWRISLTTELALAYLCYAPCAISKSSAEAITVRVMCGFWTEVMRTLRADQRRMHVQTLYCNGTFDYTIPELDPSLFIRPSCLDVWTTHLEEKYFNMWRKALRVIRARRFRDVNAAIPWMPNGPLATKNEYANLLIDHSVNVIQVAAYRKGLIPDIQ